MDAQSIYSLTKMNSFACFCTALLREIKPLFCWRVKRCELRLKYRRAKGLRLLWLSESFKQCYQFLRKAHLVFRGRTFSKLVGYSAISSATASFRRSSQTLMYPWSVARALLLLVTKRVYAAGTVVGKHSQRYHNHILNWTFLEKKKIGRDGIYQIIFSCRHYR